MYHDYFGLREAPFSIAPNPHYLYMSHRHSEALAHLLYGIRSDGGFILLTGEVGTGKTTVCRCLLEQIPEATHIAFILNPKLTAQELLATICDDLGISYPAGASIKILVDHLNSFLLEANESDHRVVLIIDEAQNLDVDVLEQLRLLTNLETNQRKLLQIILLGQPELLALLAKPELRQLTQRVTARFHLDALSRSELDDYLAHRLAVAGCQRPLFSRGAKQRIFALSGGIPRIINLICDRALLGAYAEGQNLVTGKTVSRAATEVLGKPVKTSWKPAAAIAASVAAVLAATALLTIGTPELEMPSMAGITLQQAPDPGKAAMAVPTPQAPLPKTSAMNAAPPETAVTIGNVSPIQAPADIAEPLVTTTAVSNIQGHRNRESAYVDLFTVWGYHFQEPDGNACGQAATIGLACWSSLASIQAFANLNRPAIINLNNSWVTITQVGATTATVIASNREYEISLQSLATSWDGEFTLLWKTPPGYQQPLKAGDDGPTVDHLASALAPDSFVSGHPFDQQLSEQVREFQLAVNLRPDGLVGPRTFIHLNSRTGNVPLLGSAP